MSELFVSSQVLVLKAFIDSLRDNYPVQYIYDENMDYTSAITRERAETFKKRVKNSPFIAFNRSVLRACQHPPADRTKCLKITNQTDGDKIELYKAVYAEFDVNLTLFSNSIQDIENFEILYLAGSGPFKDKIIYVPTKGLIGFDLQYNVQLSDLSDKRFELDGVFYKSITGMATIRGFYLIIRGKKEAIKEIMFSIKDDKTFESYYDLMLKG